MTRAELFEAVWREIMDGIRVFNEEHRGEAGALPPLKLVITALPESSAPSGRKA